MSSAAGNASRRSQRRLARLVPRLRVRFGADRNELDVLARRVARLSPSHRNPEDFHIEKSEIATALRTIARRS